MHELYNKYINSQFGKHIEDSAYLDIFSQPNHVPRNLKLTRSTHLEHLLEYLIHFFQRTKPLQNIDRIFKVETEFVELWDDYKIEGLENKGLENGHISTVIDLDYYSTVEELMEVCPEKLKEGSAALGLKNWWYGESANREAIPYKGSRCVGLNGAPDASQQTDDVGQISLMETKLKRIYELLSEIGFLVFCLLYIRCTSALTLSDVSIYSVSYHIATNENFVKKQALTYEEMEAARKEEEVQADTKSDNEKQ
ncbi:hypothetical protein AQUCO_00901025v1 [Aquilegia coerulea]|uniref:Uncharacterized protein n=1 Tax=Aquilegia coerulea TaxID=218851 RepID=A0A2G5EGG2_AQUCA|nr:hypothetical protein AQUCO_00901025v1 [Aquilegia coerulea]